MSHKRQARPYGYRGQAEDAGAKALSHEEPKRVPTNILVRPLRTPAMTRVKR